MAEAIVHYSGPVLSARESFDAGEKRYFTGAPCRYGHIAQRMVANGCCLQCMKVRRIGRGYAGVKAWRKANPEKKKEADRRYILKHPDKIAAKAKRYRKRNGKRIRPIEAARTRIRRAQNPETTKAIQERHRLKKMKALEAIAQRKRPSVCDACGGNSLGVVFDHCHKHGHFRGWICGHCNMALGLLKDNSSLLRKLAKYLDRSNGKVEQQRTEFAPLEGFWSAEREEVSFGKP